MCAASLTHIEIGPSDVRLHQARKGSTFYGTCRSTSLRQAAGGSCRSADDADRARRTALRALDDHSYRTCRPRYHGFPLALFTLDEPQLRQPAHPAVDIYWHRELHRPAQRFELYRLAFSHSLV